MKVKCIKNGCIFTELGEVFEVEKETVYGYVVNTNFGKLLVWKFDFEIVKEDKMENRIVRKLEDLDGLENGMGLRVVASDVSDFKDYKNISVSVYKGDCRIADIKGPAKKKLETLKSMGFKAEYKPLRTKEEVIAEMTAKTDNIFKEDRNYDLYEVEFIKFTKLYKIRLAETVGAPVFVAGLAQKYADELNEILKNN